MLGQSAAASTVISGPIPISGSGGDLVLNIGDYQYVVFKNAGTTEFVLNTSAVLDVLIVGGGGVGGDADGPTNKAGSGGGGGVRNLTNQSLSQGSYTVTVGAHASNSQVSGSGINQIGSGSASGKGGGLSQVGFAANAPAQGFAGGSGSANATGGGGGASQVGQDPRSSAYGGNGGSGSFVDWTVAMASDPLYVTGSDHYAGFPNGWYGGGGAGAGWDGVSGELGDPGLGGGGYGTPLTPAGQLSGEGINNTGGGGRGGWIPDPNLPIRNGGSGVVIFRYQVIQ